MNAINLKMYVSQNFQTFLFLNYLQINFHGIRTVEIIQHFVLLQEVPLHITTKYNKISKLNYKNNRNIGKERKISCIIYICLYIIYHKKLTDFKKVK